MMTQPEAFRHHIGDDGIAVITIDVPGESQNTLKADFIDQATAILDTLAGASGVDGIIIRSGKPGSFIAGADIGMLAACTTAAEAQALSEAGQAFFDRLAAWAVPVVAAIDGPCLGGGLELALACHGRVATDNPKTALGLPEVMLGVLPGSGGTQRLPALIGVPAALDLMLTGKQLRPAKARKLGLVDDVVPATILDQAARKRLAELRNGVPTRRKPGLMARATTFALEGNPLGLALVFKKAREQVQAKTHGNYPAPPRIIDAVETGVRRGRKAGLAAEARFFGELAVSPEARELMGIYFATTAMKKDRGVDDDTVQPRTISHVGVLGAGLMGAGIAYVTADKAGLPVRLKDRDGKSLAHGVAYTHKLVDKRRKRGSVSAFESVCIQGRVLPTLDYSGFKQADVVIEAVFEDVELKHRMVNEVEAHAGPRTIFATNTSSIPITRIAAAAARPAQVIGMHYFSPVEKMPLLEVIATDNTAPEVIATVVELGKRQGKTVIVVRDGAGFYVNRILAPYINEAGHMLAEGVPFDTIDKALVQFGFPVGPFTLLDEVGIDVGAKVGPILHEAFGDRLRPATTAEAMLADGRKGRKSGKGFYTYDGRKKQPDAAVYGVLGITPSAPPSAEAIAERCVLPMINEAIRCLDEGIIRSARDGDIGAVFGIGFPPFRGGPFRYADRLGATVLLERLNALAAIHGERFSPAPGLGERATSGAKFHG